MDDPPDVDDLAGDHLDSTERTGTRAQGKFIGVLAARAICTYRVPASGTSDGDDSNQPTIEACGGGSACVVPLFHRAIAAEPRRTERIAFAAKTRRGILVNNRGK